MQENTKRDFSKQVILIMDLWWIFNIVHHSLSKVHILNIYSCYQILLVDEDDSSGHFYDY